jgi:hypothetical protein
MRGMFQHSSCRRSPSASGYPRKTVTSATGRVTGKPGAHRTEIASASLDLTALMLAAAGIRRDFYCGANLLV